MADAVRFDQFDQEWTDRVLGKRSCSGIDGYLGIVITECTPGRLVAGFEVTGELVTIMGNVHGGCVSALVDHVLGMVMYPVMPPGSWAATTEFKINLLAPVTAGRVEATGTIVAMSRRLAVVRIDVGTIVLGADGEEPKRRLVAVAQGTSTIVAPKAG